MMPRLSVLLLPNCHHFLSVIFHVLVELVTFILGYWSTGSRQLDPETDKAHLEHLSCYESEAKQTTGNKSLFQQGVSDLFLTHLR